MLVAASRWSGWRARRAGSAASLPRAHARRRRARRRCPPTLLQVGLRDATAPWFHTNDSTYQIELAGDLVLDGENPYGHDYSRLRARALLQPRRRAASPERGRQVALDALRVLPRRRAHGCRVAAASDAVRRLPLVRPAGDDRLLPRASSLFPAPLAWRLGARRCGGGEPAARSAAAWFGTADAPSLLCARARVRARHPPALRPWRRPASPPPILLKQFALVAVPFFASAPAARGGRRPTLSSAAPRSPPCSLAGFLPFLARRPGRALGGHGRATAPDTYRILGYGLSALLLNAGDHRRPLRRLPVRAARRCSSGCRSRPGSAARPRARGRAWEAAAGFAVSMFVLLFIARVFQTSYLVWPLAGIAMAVRARGYGAFRRDVRP